MELQKLTESVRYRTENDGIRMEANVIKEDGNTRIESGNIARTSDGKWIGNFSKNNGRFDYNLQAADRKERESLAQSIEDFIEELENTVE